MPSGRRFIHLVAIAALVLSSLSIMTPHASAAVPTCGYSATKTQSWSTVTGKVNHYGRALVCEDNTKITDVSIRNNYWTKPWGSIAWQTSTSNHIGPKNVKNTYADAAGSYYFGIKWNGINLSYSSNSRHNFDFFMSGTAARYNYSWTKG